MIVDRWIEKLKSINIHTPRIAIARFLLAFGLLLTLMTNRLDMVANHNYKNLPDFSVKHTTRASVPFKKMDLFLMMNPEKAKLVVVCILLLVMTGLFPQVTCLLNVWACFSIHNYFMMLNSGDEIAFVLSILLLPICLTDPRLNQWKQKAPTNSRRNIVANITMLVIHMQVAWVYFDASFSKLFVKLWSNGTAVFYYTSHYRSGAPNWLRSIDEWVTLTPMVKLLTWGVLAFEFIMVACLFLPARIKRLFFIPAIIFHLFLTVHFGLISFFFSDLAMLFLFLDTEDRFASKIYGRRQLTKA